MRAEAKTVVRNNLAQGRMRSSTGSYSSDRDDANPDWHAGDVQVTILPGLLNSLTRYRILIHELEHVIQRQYIAKQNLGEHL